MYASPLWEEMWEQAVLPNLHHQMKNDAPCLLILLSWTQNESIKVLGSRQLHQVVTHYETFLVSVRCLWTGRKCSMAIVLLHLNVCVDRSLLLHVFNFIQVLRTQEKNHIMHHVYEKGQRLVWELLFWAELTIRLLWVLSFYCEKKSVALVISFGDGTSWLFLSKSKYQVPLLPINQPRYPPFEATGLLAGSWTYPLLVIAISDWKLGQ